MKNNPELMDAIKSKNENKIFTSMKPLLYKTIKGAPYNERQDYYQELSIEVIRTIRKQYKNEHKNFDDFLKKNKLISLNGCYFS